MADYLELRLIRTDGGTQPRAQINQDTVDEYAADMGAGATFPPVVVFYDGSEYWLADGFHRVAAARKLGSVDIEADIRPGTRRDAVLYSVGANAVHGMRRTNEDKRRAVMTLLNDAEWARWSDREIARRCGVTQPFVGRVRGETSDNCYQIAPAPRLAQRNGTTYTVNTANIGQRQPVHQPLPVTATATEEPTEQETYDYDRRQAEDAQAAGFNVPLPPPPAQPIEARQDSEPAAAYITLAQWRTMTDAQRAAALKATGPAQMNKQKNSNIEWAQWSWNPVTGCRHNCSYCYARDIAARFYPQGFEPSFLPSRLSMPRNTPVPASAAQDIGYKNVFTCSMADLFGRWVPREWIEAVLQVVADNPQWNFLFLTKFPIRLAEFDFPANAWLGTTVDAQARVANAERAFSKVRGGVKWLSCEPLLEPLRFTSLDMFDWVVIGGASGSTQTPEFRPPRAWVESLEAQARRAGCKVYEKTNLLERIREYPGVETAAPVNVPDAFKMTYLQRDVLTPTAYQEEFV